MDFCFILVSLFFFFIYNFFGGICFLFFLNGEIILTINQDWFCSLNRNIIFIFYFNHRYWIYYLFLFRCLILFWFNTFILSIISIFWYRQWNIFLSSQYNNRRIYYLLFHYSIDHHYLFCFVIFYWDKFFFYCFGSVCFSIIWCFLRFIFSWNWIFWNDFRCINLLILSLFFRINL